MTRKISPNQLAFALPGARMPTPLSRATARRTRSWETPAPKPWRCVVLGIDTARCSGWALYGCGILEDYGEVDTHEESVLAQLVSNAVDLAARLTVPCVLVLEAPYGGSVAVVTALGAARERWMRAWRASAQPEGRVLRVQPSTWRGPVLGAEWVSAPREMVRAHEVVTARALVATRWRGRPKPGIGHDAAAAVLIGRWAVHAAATGRAIGKRAARASVRSWTGAFPS